MSWGRQISVLVVLGVLGFCQLALGATHERAGPNKDYPEILKRL